MKRIFLLSMSVFVVLTFAAVGGETSPTLFNTKWKLNGFFDAKAGKLEKPDYSVADSGIRDLYTLEFASDSAVKHENREYRISRGNLAQSSFLGFYTADYARSTLEFEVIIRPTKADSADGERYDRALYLSRKFELKDNRLKLFYGDGGDYLLFGSFDPSAAPENNAVASDAAGNGNKAVSEVNLAEGNFTAGPNPVAKSGGLVNFYRDGKALSSGTLKVFDASGKFVSKVSISDKTGDGSRRPVGTWNLRDRKGKSVPEGTYLVKGTVKTIDGKAEKVSLLLGVR